MAIDNHDTILLTGRGEAAKDTPDRKREKERDKRPEPEASGSATPAPSLVALPL